MQSLKANVFYDSASVHAWSDLNESAFLERVLAELESKMGDEFTEYTFFILSSPRGKVRPDSIAHPSGQKVLIYVSDESPSIPADLQSHYRAIFKNHLRHELPGSNIFPFNLGYVRDVPAFDVKPIDDRTISAFFSGNLSWTRRPLYRAFHPAYRRLPKLVFRTAAWIARRRWRRWLMPTDLSRAIAGSVVRFTDGFQRGLTREDYGRSLADSRIVLCPRGAWSQETFRHIEAMRAGAVLISEPLPDTHFYRGAPFVTIADWETGLDRAKELLRDQTALAQIQRDTISWWENVCCEAATAAFMHSTLKAISTASEPSTR